MQVWQSSEDALLQMVVVVLVRLAAENNMLPGWDNLGTGGQLLLVRSMLIFPLFPTHTRFLYVIICIGLNLTLTVLAQFSKFYTAVVNMTLIC